MFIYPVAPPRPEAIIDAIIKLRKKVANESIQERDILSQTHRYYSVTHQMKPVPPIVTGEYLQSPTREQPPQALEQAMGLPIPTTSQVAVKQEN
jgi:NAD(P)H-quinone oxidoreductase subunit K